MGENEIEKVACYKYLGVLFDQHLKFTSCSESLSESAGRALSSIISKLQSFTFCKVNYDSFTKIFMSCVRPILDYGASIWGFNNERLGQRIQDRAVRYYLGVHRFTPIPGLHSEMGWLNIKFHFFLCMLRYWNRLMKMDFSRLTRKIFEYDFTHIKGANWSGKILSIAKKLQMEDVLIKGETFDLKYVQEKLFCLMQEEWADKIPAMPKLRYYIKFKSDIITASYLKANITRTQRSLLAQLRLGILPLAIETDRYYRIPLDKRFCKLCDENVIEDEIHFICICKFFVEEREALFDKIALCWPDFRNYSLNEQFIYIMSYDDKIVGKYVEKTWFKRKSMLLL